MSLYKTFLKRPTTRLLRTHPHSNRVTSLEIPFGSSVILTSVRPPAVADRSTKQEMDVWGRTPDFHSPVNVPGSKSENPRHTDVTPLPETERDSYALYDPDLSLRMKVPWGLWPWLTRGLTTTRSDSVFTTRKSLSGLRTLPNTFLWVSVQMFYHNRPSKLINIPIWFILSLKKKKDLTYWFPILDQGPEVEVDGWNVDLGSLYLMN